MQEDIVYLGFVILVNDLKIDPEKVKAIFEWHTPKNMGEVISFHGLANFYLKFIWNSVMFVML